jgi:predicted transcriptional regulator
MRARDIMVQDFDTIGMDAPLTDAIEKLRRRTLETGRIDVRCLVVTDAGGTPVHVLTEADVIKAVLPWFFREKKFSDFVSRWLARDLPQAALDELFRDLARTARKKAVKEVAMAEGPLISVDEDDSILRVAYTMHSEKIKTLPVTRQGKIVGIVFRAAVFEAIAHEIHSTKLSSSPTIAVPKAD